MKTVSFNELTKNKQKEFFSWLKDQKNNDPAYENMWDDNWQDNSATLPFILLKTEKYKGSNGDFHIVYDDLNVVACAGVYKSFFNSLIAIAGTRTWVAEKYRNKLIVGYELLPLHKKWARENNCKQVALSFNEYNKNLIKIWQRQRLGEQSRLPKTNSRMFAENLHQVDGPVIIQKTKQWVIYEKLDPDWNFNWNTIADQSK